MGPRRSNRDPQLHQANHRLSLRSWNNDEEGVTGNLPLSDTIWEYLSTLLLVVLVPLGAWQIWKARQREANSVVLAFALGALSIFVVLAIRVASGDGSELAGRAMTFALIPVSIVCAIVVIGRVRSSREGAASSSHRFRYQGMAAPAPRCSPCWPSEALPADSRPITPGCPDRTG